MPLAAAARRSVIGVQRIGSRRQQIQTAVLPKRLRDADPLPLAHRVGGMAAPAQRLSTGCMLAGADQRYALLHQVAIGGARAIPFEHREFRMVGCAPLAVAEDMSELPDPRHPGDEQLLHRKFGRGVEIAQRGPPLLRVVKLGGECPEMRFEPRAHLQSRRVDLDEAAIGEEAANSCEDFVPAYRASRGAMRSDRAATIPASSCPRSCRCADLC